MRLEEQLKDKYLKTNVAQCPTCLNDTFQFYEAQHPLLKDYWECKTTECHRAIIIESDDTFVGT